MSEQGWSMVDGYAVYHYTGNDFVHFKLIYKLEDLGIKTGKAKIEEISNSIVKEESDVKILAWGTVKEPYNFVA